MKHTDFRNFLNKVETLTEGKPTRKALNESPADTYYVTKMKERFNAMESEFESNNEMPVERTPAIVKELPVEAASEEMSEDELSTAVAHVYDICSDHDAEHQTTTCEDLKKILSHYGYEGGFDGKEEGSEVEMDSNEEEPKVESSKSKFGGFARFM